MSKKKSNNTGVVGVVVASLPRAAVPFTEGPPQYLPEGTSVDAWYFAPDSLRLKYGDRRLIAEGVVHTVTVEPMVCEQGLHACEKAYDALTYAPGAILCRVKLEGKITNPKMSFVEDKMSASSRTYIKILPAHSLLDQFARELAANLLAYWAGAPEVVVKYLATGDESLRQEALDACGPDAIEVERKYLAIIVSAIEMEDQPTGIGKLNILHNEVVRPYRFLTGLRVGSPWLHNNDPVAARFNTMVNKMFGIEEVASS